MNAACNKIITLENRRNSIQYVIACFLYVVGYHILKRNHIFIHITGSRYKILLVCILAGKLETNEVASVIKASRADNRSIIGILLPAGRLYRGDIATLLGRHYLSTYTCHNVTASAQVIKRTVILVSLCGELTRLKIGLIIINLGISLACISHYRLQSSALL